jgi:hypothetical protein
VKLEQIAKDSSRALGDEDRIRPGDARKRAARFGDSPTTPHPRAQIADHDQAGRDADT